MGTAADPRTHKLRKQAHEVFDLLWRSGTVDRDTAYAQLASFFGLPREEAHIGRFTYEQCREVIYFFEKFDPRDRKDAKHSRKSGSKRAWRRHRHNRREVTA